MKLLFSAALVVFTIHVGIAQRNITTLSGITAIKSINGKVFFVGSHDQYGAELFVSDGSSGNAKVLKDISPGYGGSSPSGFTIFNDQLFFTAYSSDYGLAVWKSDGTSEGTQLVYGVENAEPMNLMVFKGKLYFTTALGSIIRTDGTSAGTEIFYQSEYTWGRIMTVVKSDQYIYFSTDGRTIYRDNGSSRIEFLGPLSWEDVYFRNIFVLNNSLVVIKSATYDNVIRIYSISNDVLGDEEEDEWVLIKKLDAPVYGRQEIENFTNASGKLFFSFRTYFDNVTPADELWVCDGTEAGTKMVKSFGWSPHSYKSEMGMFFAFKGKLFFRGGDPVNRTLWTSNGTTEGTVKFHDAILTAPYNDERTPVLVTENEFFFSGGTTGNIELWNSNGTAEGTRQILDMEDDGGSFPHDFSFSNDVLYFVTSQQFSTTLWSTVPAAEISLMGPWSTAIKSGSAQSLFNEIALGRCNTTEITIKNKGLQELYLSSIFVTGKDFYIAQQLLPGVIAPGESIPLKIIFNPITESKSRATLTILSNDSNEAKYVIYLEAAPSPFATTPEICQFNPNDYVKSLQPGEITKPIVLSNSSVVEGQPQGTVIGEFSLPANATFTLVAGEGDVDNQSFFIEGNRLKSNTIFYFDLKNVYSLRVKAIAQEGESEASFRIHVSNTSFGFAEGNCQPAFERVSFAYTSLESNAEGHLFATTSNGQILRSMDSGHSWKVVYITNSYSRLSGIIFKGNTGYAQGDNTVLKSDDGGATWFKLYIPFTGEYYFNNLGVFFLNDKEGFISTQEGEIFFTSDGGRTWETHLQGSWNEFRKLYFISKDKGYATVGWGELFQTADGGRSWLAVDLSALGWNTRVQDLWFTNENVGFMIGEYKLYKTIDGGKHWTEVPNISVGDGMRIKFLNENVGFLYGLNGILNKTTNGGDTWDQSFPSISPGGIIGIAQASGKLFIGTKNYYYNYETAKGLAVSADQGATWSTLNYFSDGNIYRIDFPVHNKGVVIGVTGIFKTEDSGMTWNQMVSDLTDVADMHFIDENTVILVSNGHIYKSTDGGITSRNVLTTEQGEHYLPAGRLYSFSGNILFAVSWYAIYRSDDLGETWEMVSTNPGYYTQGMHFISSAIGYRVELLGSIEKTIDGGKTWSEIFTRDPETANPFNALFFIDESVGYKGGNFLERTTNGGISWEKVDWPFYEIIAIHFENENHGYVITSGGVVYETNNAGSTWQTIFSGSEKVFDVQFRNQEILLAGENGFIVRMNRTPATPSLPGYIYGPGKVCVGDVTEFHLAINSDYRTQWSTTAGNIEDHSNYITVNFPNPGEYTVTAKHFNLCGVSESRTTTVLVSAPPAAPIIEGPNPAVAGEQDVPYSVINREQEYTFLWEVEGSSNSTLVENGILVDWTSNTKDGEITVLAVDASGCRSYGTLNVSVEVPLAVESNLLNQVSLYPNPSEADTKIISSYGRLLSVRIIDILGNEYSRTILSGGQEQTMLTRQLPSGLYLVEISDGKHSVTKKLIRK
jgi:ELWxxDGT repeat protein